MTTPLNTRILIADDHPVVLRGLRNLLNAHSDLKVVAEATDGEQALERALAEDLHLAILDISMPRMTGLDAAREITRRRPGLRVLMLSMQRNGSPRTAERQASHALRDSTRSRRALSVWLRAPPSRIAKLTANPSRDGRTREAPATSVTPLHAPHRLSSCWSTLPESESGVTAHRAWCEPRHVERALEIHTAA
jgi:CheY-like chemotaxis protein